MQQVTKSMGKVVSGMDKVLGSMNVEQISKVMENFERSFEDMDVRSEYVEQTMNSSTTAAMPEEEVDTLMQVGDVVPSRPPHNLMPTPPDADGRRRARAQDGRQVWRRGHGVGGELERAGDRSIA